MIWQDALPSFPKTASQQLQHRQELKTTKIQGTTR